MVEDQEFAHRIGAPVGLRLSGESGEVIGRAQYLNSENSYLVRYVARDGRQVEQWWAASAIVSAE